MDFLSRSFCESKLDWACHQGADLKLTDSERRELVWFLAALRARKTVEYFGNYILESIAETAWRPSVSPSYPTWREFEAVSGCCA